MQSSARPSSHQFCRACGASSYRAVIQRDAQGAMRPSGLYRCSGCSLTFSNPRQWQVGGGHDFAASPVGESLLQADVGAEESTARDA